MFGTELVMSLIGLAIALFAVFSVGALIVSWWRLGKRIDDMIERYYGKE